MLRSVCITASILLGAAAASAADPPSWRVTVGHVGDKPVVTVEASGENGVTRLEGWCRPDFGPEFRFKLLDYSGTGLGRPSHPDAEHTHRVAFVVEGPRGTTRHVNRMYYLAWENMWQSGDPLGTPFLDAFAEGTAMSLVNEEGRVVARYGLRGSRAARETVRRVCGL